MNAFASSAGITRKFLSDEIGGSFEVELLLRKSLGPGIVPVGVVVEVAQIDNVDSQALKTGTHVG